MNVPCRGGLDGLSVRRGASKKAGVRANQSKKPQNNVNPTSEMEVVKVENRGG